MIDIYRDTATRDKLIFPSAITCILSHVHVTFPLFTHFYAMGAISKESIRRSNAQLAAKRPRVEFTSTDATTLLDPLPHLLLIILLLLEQRSLSHGSASTHAC